MADAVCASCRQVVVDEPSGFCEDCQEGIPSQKPGTITPDQRDVLVGMLMDQGMVGDGKWKARAILIAEVVPGWPYGGDLGALSQQQAEDLVARLEQRKREA
jgi:hypothetical protein